MMNRVILAFILLLLNLAAQAQSTPEMADNFRREGKIYVVVAIVLVVLLGFLSYLFFIDRKISRLEKKIKDKN